MDRHHVLTRLTNYFHVVWMHQPGWRQLLPGCAPVRPPHGTFRSPANLPARFLAAPAGTAGLAGPVDGAASLQAGLPTIARPGLPGRAHSGAWNSRKRWKRCRTTSASTT